MTAPQIPQPYEILAPFVDEVVRRLPKSRQHFNSGTGRWSHIYVGLRAQVARMLKRQALEAKAARLPLAEGDELRELAASELDTILPSEPRRAIGHVELTRATGSFPAGVFRAGDRWTKSADPSARPIAIPAAEYETIAPVVIANGGTTATVPIRATREGTHANVVQTTGADSAVIRPATGTLWDPAWTVTRVYAGGGSEGLDDESVRRAAAANAQGRFGPTQGAIIAGAYQTQGARYLAPFDYLPTHPIGARAVALTFLADASWGWSHEWTREADQVIANAGLGFGCRHQALGVSNTFVSVDAVVRLRLSQDMLDTTGIEANIRTAVRSFFDDRPDWYTWTAEALRRAITAADFRIQVCEFVDVRSATTGNQISPPPATGLLGPGGELVHFYVADNGCTVTVLPPS